ncbi:MAG: GGDEF domain-containing protein [Magnetovibrionaceae bacterium]
MTKTNLPETGMAEEVSDGEPASPIGGDTPDQLRQTIADLELALETAIQHGDAIEDDLLALNDELKQQVRERELAEQRLEQVLAAVRQQKDDLELLVETITAHSDDIDASWLARFSDLEELSRTDELTGLANRRAFDQALDREWVRAQRLAKPLTVAMCDVDFFKQFNDQQGHAAGDAALRAVADCLRSSCRRPVDIAARYGGEEFVVLLPDTDQAGGEWFGRVVAGALADASIPHRASASGKLTISMGIVTVLAPEGAESPRRLLDAADRLLYAAKASGRNSIQSALFDP